MLQKRRKQLQASKIDAVGMLSSGLCALHCAALPFLLYFGVIGGVSSVAHDSFEAVVLICSIGLAAWSSWRGLRLHGRVLPQFFIAVGMLVLILGFAISLHEVMAVGGLFLVSGHWLNHKYQITLSS